MKHFLLLLTFFLSAAFLYPQNNRWASYFSQQAVTALSSENRFIWAGTQKGVIRLDKITGEKMFFQKSNSGLPSDYVTGISIDSKGNKWIATDSGLVKFDGTNWTSYHPFPLELPESNIDQDIIISMSIDQQDNVWLTGSKGSFMKFDGISWTKYREKDYGVQDTIFTCIAIDKKGNKWVGSNGIGLFKFDGASWTNFNLSNSPLPNGFITSLAIDSSGAVWAGTQHGIAKFDGTNWTAFSKIDSLFYFNPAGVTIDKNGIVWFGLYGEGLLRYDGKTFTVINSQNSELPSNSVFRILSDPDGTKWMGTYDNEGFSISGEIIKFDDKNWTIFKTANSELPSDQIAAVTVDSLNNKWIAAGGKILRFDGVTWTVFGNMDFNVALGSLVFLTADPKGKVWAKYENKLLKFNGEFWGQLEGSVPGLPDGSANFDNVNSIAFDSKGNIWMGLPYGGLLKYDGMKWSLFNSSNSPLPDNREAYVACDPNGNLLAVLFDTWDKDPIKIVKFDGTNWTTFTSAISFTAGGITGLTADLKGNVYVSTWSGLLRFDGTNWTLYTSGNSGLAVNSIKSAAEDKNGNLWIGSSWGFQKFDGVNWTLYTSRNSGLSGRYSNQVNSIAFDRQGNMWLATDDGLNVFREDGLISSTDRKTGKQDLPGSYSLEQNYPNPFNPSTRISFSVPEGNLVKLTVYDIIGREVTTLVNEYKPKGSYTVEFIAGNLPSGVYVYTIQAGEFSYSKKLVLLR